MKRLHDHQALCRELSQLCKWPAVPPRVLAAVSAGLPPPPPPPLPSAAPSDAAAGPTGNGGDDENTPPDVRRLQQHLAASVALEWRCEAVGDLKLVHPTLNAQAVAAPGGVLCFGGRTSEAASQVMVEHAESWLVQKGLIEDHSQVYKVGPAAGRSAGPRGRCPHPRHGGKEARAPWAGRCSRPSECTGGPAASQAAGGSQPAMRCRRVPCSRPRRQRQARP